MSKPIQRPDLIQRGRRVLCKSTNLVWRTLPSAKEAERWLNAAVAELPKPRRDLLDD